MVARLDWVHYNRILKIEHEAQSDNRNRLLAQFPIFRDWPSTLLLRVSRLFEYKEYKRGDAVLLQGLKNTKVFIVATGLVGIVIHIKPKTEVEQKVADRWLKTTRSAPTQKMARRKVRKTTVGVARLGPGHHFSNVKRSAEDPRKLTVRWDRKTRENSANAGALGELAAVLHPSDLAPFTVVCHTDCIVYRIDMTKLYELQTTDISLLRSFYETSPEIPDSSYIRDLVHQQINWNRYKDELVNEVVESRSHRNVHGDMIAGESLVSRRSRGSKFNSSNLSTTSALPVDGLAELAVMDSSPIGSTRGPSRNISQPPTKTSLLREFRASQQRLSSTSLPEISQSSNQSISLAHPQGQGYLPGEPRGNGVREGRAGGSVSIDAVTAKGGRHEAQLSRSAAAYRRWIKTKENAANVGASVRVPTPKLVSGNGIARERAIHKRGTDSGLGHLDSSLAGAISATDHLTALVLEQRDKLKEAKRGAGIYGNTLWEKHADLVPTEKMEPLEKLKGWNAMRKAGAQMMQRSFVVVDVVVVAVPPLR